MKLPGKCGRVFVSVLFCNKKYTEEKKKECRPVEYVCYLWGAARTFGAKLLLPFVFLLQLIAENHVILYRLCNLFSIEYILAMATKTCSSHVPSRSVGGSLIKISRGTDWSFGTKARRSLTDYFNHWFFFLSFFFSCYLLLNGFHPLFLTLRMNGHLNYITELRSSHCPTITNWKQSMSIVTKRQCADVHPSKQSSGFYTLPFLNFILSWFTIVYSTVLLT